MKPLVFILTLLCIAATVSTPKIGRPKLYGRFGPNQIASSCSAVSADFDGSAYLTKSGAFTNPPAGNDHTILMSFWMKVSGLGVDRYLIHADNGRYSVHLNSDDNIYVDLYSTGGGEILLLKSTTSITVDVWHHVLIGADVSTAAESYIYLDDVDVTDRQVHVINDIDYVSASSWGIAAKANGTQIFSGKLSEFYLTNEYIDVTMASNRQKFRSAAGFPVSLGSDGHLPTGNRPRLYFYQSVPNWDVNQGDGPGTWAETGGTIGNGGADTPCVP